MNTRSVGYCLCLRGARVHVCVCGQLLCPSAPVVYLAILALFGFEKSLDKFTSSMNMHNVTHMLGGVDSPCR